MSSGIRATVEFSTASICPIVELSEAAETTIDTVSRNTCPSDCDAVVAEFFVDAEYDPDDVEPIFSHGSMRRYRLESEDGFDCPCTCLGRFGCSVDRYVAREGTLTLSFYAADYEALRDIVARLRERYSGMDIKRFIQSPGEDQRHDRVFVDRGKLTSRQLEVLEAAHERGYFDRPRGANATEIAAELDIDPSTFREHLTAAQTKLLGDVLEEG